MIEILCDNSTSCKEVCDNNDNHRSRQRQTFNMSVKSLRLVCTISFIVLSCTNVKLSFLIIICGSIFSIICTVLENVSKRSLITSVTTVHGLDNQK